VTKTTSLPRLGTQTAEAVFTAELGRSSEGTLGQHAFLPCCESDHAGYEAHARQVTVSGAGACGFTFGGAASTWRLEP